MSCSWSSRRGSERLCLRAPFTGLVSMLLDRIVVFSRSWYVKFFSDLAIVATVIFGAEGRFIGRKGERVIPRIRRRVLKPWGKVLTTGLECSFGHHKA
ncbi:hypothetical protein VNO77_19378 [Canavalia gladiata]|uniref:Uncharacterized protein n=1 Tax=Canavalia gladiata TaxID=3824 RepID=A0AAN9QKF6_CANGL